MGNTVSAAEIAATQIIHPNKPIKTDQYHKNLDSYSGDIPPECPMHKKVTMGSECPVGGGSDINPLNMVSYSICENDL